jgi:hypothetical protein
LAQSYNIFTRNIQVLETQKYLTVSWSVLHFSSITYHEKGSREKSVLEFSPEPWELSRNSSNKCNFLERQDACEIRVM